MTHILRTRQQLLCPTRRRDRTKVLKRTQEKAMKARAFKSMNEVSVEVYTADNSCSGHLSFENHVCFLSFGHYQCRTSTSAKKRITVYQYVENVYPLVFCNVELCGPLRCEGWGRARSSRPQHSAAKAAISILHVSGFRRNVRDILAPATAYLLRALDGYRSTTNMTTRPSRSFRTIHGVL